jgi:hypothetical protein
MRSVAQKRAESEIPRSLDAWANLTNTSFPPSLVSATSWLSMTSKGHFNFHETKHYWPPLWSSGQSSWLQIRRPGLDSRHYPKKSSGSGTGSTQPREYNWGATWQKSSGSCLENREYGRRDPSRWPRGTLYPQKLAMTSPTSGGRSVGIVRSRTQTMEFVLVFDETLFHTHTCGLNFGKLTEEFMWQKRFTNIFLYYKAVIKFHDINTNDFESLGFLTLSIVRNSK